MDWKEFFASIVGSLAWPIGVIALALIILLNFRVQIRGLLSRMRTVKGGGVEATFAEEVEQTKDIAEALLEEASEAGAPDGPLPSRPEPVALIITAWEELELVIRTLYEHATTGGDGSMLVTPSTISVRGMLNSLLDRGIIDVAFFNTVSQLRDLRNRVVHGHVRPTTTEALSYAQSASTMIEYAQITQPAYLNEHG